MMQPNQPTPRTLPEKEFPGTSDTRQPIVFSTKKVVITLLLLTGILLILHISVYFLSRRIAPSLAEPLDGLFNLSRESNFPTYFSAFLLLFSGLLTLVIYQYQEKSKGKFRLQWMLLGLVFIFLSLDEAVQIHERLTNISGQKFAFLNTGFLSFAWVIPYTVLFLAVAVYFLKFVLALPKRTRSLFFAAGVLFIGGALGFEFIEGYVFNQSGFNTVYWVLATIEEIMEITGVITLIYALLDYMKSCSIYIGIKE